MLCLLQKRTTVTWRKKINRVTKIGTLQAYFETDIKLCRSLSVLPAFVKINQIKSSQASAICT